MSEPSDFEPRPEFLDRLREAVRDEVGEVDRGGPDRAEPAAESRRPLPAIPGIEILREIGRGGMGTVHLARQIGLDRLVAVKLVWLGRGDSQRNALALAKGPRAIAELVHPNIIHIIQIGKRDGWAHGVFEYLSGGDLKEALRRDGPWLPGKAAELVRTLAQAVEFIHRRGFVHCDLKCSNVLLSAEGVPKIADFGLVQLIQDGAAAAPGALVGTPGSMAPEQADGLGRPIGPAVDVHALGLILYELLTGHSPFSAPTREETLRRVIELIPDPPSRLRGGIPPELDAICARCLQKDPSQRGGAGELAEELGRYLDGEERANANHPSPPGRRWAQPG